MSIDLELYSSTTSNFIIRWNRRQSFHDQRKFDRSGEHRHAFTIEVQLSAQSGNINFYLKLANSSVRCLKSRQKCVIIAVDSIFLIKSELWGSLAHVCFIEVRYFHCWINILYRKWFVRKLSPYLPYFDHHGPIFCPNLTIICLWEHHERDRKNERIQKLCIQKIDSPFGPKITWWWITPSITVSRPFSISKVSDEFEKIPKTRGRKSSFNNHPMITFLYRRNFGWALKHPTTKKTPLMLIFLRSYSFHRNFSWMDSKVLYLKSKLLFYN